MHIHHGLQPAADAWVVHCRDFCAQRGVDCVVHHASLDANAGNLEAMARQARYAFFRQTVGQQEMLLLAHHADDQAETVLLRLMRGAGVRGLGAMAAFMPFGAGFLSRPLLTLSRDALEEYARAHRLSWIEDESNRDERFERNFLRWQVMPQLRDRWPGADQCLARAASHCRESQDLLDELAQADLAMATAAGDDQLNCDALLALGAARRRNALRYWMHQLGYTLPSAAKLEEITSAVLMARDDAQPLVAWSGVEVRRFRRKIYIMPAQKSPIMAGELIWDWQQVLPLPEGGSLHARSVQGRGISVAALRGQTLTVRYRHGGEKCRPAGRQQSKRLKTLLQEWHIPPWLRHRVPLLYQGQELIAVADLCVSEAFNSKLDEPGVLIEWRKNSVPNPSLVYNYDDE